MTKSLYALGGEVAPMRVSTLGTEQEGRNEHSGL